MIETVESFVLHGIKDQRLPERIAGFPKGREFVDRLLANCPGITKDMPDDGLTEAYQPDWTPQPIRLSRPGIYHGRSYTVDHPAIPEIWRDGNRNVYGAVSLKGINFTKPGVYDATTASQGLIAQGLLESSPIGRVLAASELLTKHRVGTEKIIGIGEPIYLPWPATGERLHPEEYKRRIIQEYDQQQTEEEHCKKPYDEVRAALTGMSFIVTARAFDTDVRLGDFLTSAANQERVYAFTNRYLLAKHEKPYTPSAHSAYRFLHDRYVPAIATNLARKNALGLTHRYLHAYNTTALGSIVDLDSVRGEPLGFGDPAATPAQRAIDTMWVATTLAEVDSQLERTIGMQANYGLTSRFVGQYMSQYARHMNRRYRQPILPTLSEVAEHCIAVPYEFNDFKPQAAAIVAGYYTGRLTSRYKRTNVKRIGAQLIEGRVKARWPTLEAQWERTLPDMVQACVNERIEDVHDPNFDLFAVLSQAPLGSPVIRDKLHNEIGALLTGGLQIGKLWTQSGIPEHKRRLPLSTDLVDSVESALLYRSGHMAQIKQAIEAAFRTLLRQSENRIRELSTFPAYRATIPGHVGTPNRCIADKQLLYQTEHVPFTELAQALDTPVWSVDALRLEPNGSTVYVASDEAAVPVEIISDGSITSLEHNDTPFGLQVWYRLADSSYAMVVEQFPDGNRRQRLYANDPSLLTPVATKHDHRIIQQLY